MPQGSRWEQLSRRDAMRLLGAGTAGFVAACGGAATSDPPPAVSAANTAAQPTDAAAHQPIIRTILCDVAPRQLGGGAILMHEHLSAASPYRFAPPPQREIPPHVTGNLALTTDEVRIAGTEGVACIVDGGHAHMGRTPDALRAIAEGSGVHIVASGGFYTRRAYPPDIGAKSVEQMTDELIAETETERFGALGEIGASGEMTPDERKMLTAVARAHLRTGLPIFTLNAYVGQLSPVPVPFEAALSQLDLFEEEGVDLGHLVIGHLCCLDQPGAEVAIEVARRGAFVGFDRVNWDAMLEDGKRAAMVTALVDAGYADKLVLTSDFYRRTELKAEGGPGYAKTVTQFVPMLREAGLDAATVQLFIADNPRRWLAFQPTTA